MDKTYRLIDSHAHLEELEDLDSAIERARQGGVVAIVAVGSDYESNNQVLEIAERYRSLVYPALGLHPGRLDKVIPSLERHLQFIEDYAWRDSFTLAQEAGVQGAIFHWYTGPTNVFNDIVSQGYFVSATLAAEYHAEHRRAIKEAPLPNLLLETDSPVVYRGHQAEPADVGRALQATAELKGLSPEIIADKTTENALKLYRIQGIENH